MTGDSKIKHVVDSAEELSNIYNDPSVLEICRFNQSLYSNIEHRRRMCDDLFLNSLYDIRKKLYSKTLI